MNNAAPYLEAHSLSVHNATLQSPLEVDHTISNLSL